MRWLARFAWLSLASLVACGGESVAKNEDGDGAGDAGERSGTTGGTSAGGASTGGAERGGLAGVNTGATGGSATGGSATGGSATAGASGGSACAPGENSTPRFTFDTDTEGFVVQGSVADTNISEPVDLDSILLGWTGTDGMPVAGALDISIPYSSSSQWVSLGVSLPAPVDLTGRVISVCMKLVSGLGDPKELMAAPGGAKVYAKTGPGYCYANGSYTNVGDIQHPGGQWMAIAFNLLRVPDYEDPTCSAPFDPSDVREIGVQFDSSALTATPLPALFRIDTLSY